jgi:hypothetical protein
MHWSMAPTDEFVGVRIPKQMSINSNLPSAHAVPRRWTRRLPGIVAALALLRVEATLGVLWARSVRVQDRYAWHPDGHK